MIIIIIMKKKISGHNRFWATTQLQKKKKFYCNAVFVLQRERELRAVCIAIQYFVL